MNSPPSRPNSPGLDALLGLSIPVLDQGFVRVIDYMGSDDAIVQAARISYGAGTRKLHEDRGLIRYLMRHRHTTPFEMCELKIHIRAPMDCWRQWIRHRTASVNEYSTRYSIAIDAAQLTPPQEWRSQSQANRQGSGSELPIEIGTVLSAREAELHQLAQDVYQERIKADVAREQARKDLPLSTYTEAYWKINLHNLLHFIALRIDTHAQKEIRSYATVLGHKIVSAWCPLTWEAFTDYQLQSIKLTRVDVEIIKAIASNADATSVAASAGLLESSGSANRANRERDELEQKLELLGLPIPWEMRKQ